MPGVRMIPGLFHHSLPFFSLIDTRVQISRDRMDSLVLLYWGDSALRSTRQSTPKRGITRCVRNDLRFSSIFEIRVHAISHRNGTYTNTSDGMTIRKRCQISRSGPILVVVQLENSDASCGFLECCYVNKPFFLFDRHHTLTTIRIDMEKFVNWFRSSGGSVDTSVFGLTRFSEQGFGAIALRDIPVCHIRPDIHNK